MTSFFSMRMTVVAAALSALVSIAAGCGANAPVPSPAASLATRTGSSAVPNTVASHDATPEPSSDATAVLLTVGTRGGRCIGGTCGTTVIVDRDGRVHLAAKPPNELGFVSPDLMVVVDDAIRTTDFAELVSHRFTGECPTAYQYHRLPSARGTDGGIGGHPRG